MDSKVKCGHFFPLFVESPPRPTAKQFLGHPRNLQNPLVSRLNPEGVYVWDPATSLLSCLAHPLVPAPPGPKLSSPSLFGFNPALFLGVGWWKHLCGEGLCYFFLAVSSSISTFERLNDAPNISGDPLCDWLPFAYVSFNLPASLCTNSRCFCCHLDTST